jgi:DNA-binding GntR family transcriptional regulator
MIEAKGLSSDIAVIKNDPLRMEVAVILRNAIINGFLKPGTPLVEVMLAEKLGVSRAPVREGILLLESEGLIETVAYKGKRVRPLTAKNIEEIYSLREQFELFAVSRIIKAGTDVSELRGHCEAMRKAAKAKDLAALNSADEGFHRDIIRLSDHSLLLSQWNNVYLRVRQVMALRNSANSDLGIVASTHAPIVEALEARDFARASELLSQHIRSAADLEVPGLEQIQ